MSTIQVNAIQSSSGTQEVTQTILFSGTAKGYIRYSQDASPGSQNLNSFNVSSYTDSAGGKSIIALTSSMSDALYNAITDGTNADTDSAYDQTHSEAFTSSQFQESTGVYSTGPVTTDFVLAQAVVFGDLA